MSISSRLSIKSKLMLMLLSTSLCSIVVVGYIGYDSGKAALTRSIFDHLTSVRASKGDQIRSYFTTIRRHLETLGEDEMIVRAMTEFRSTFHELSNRPIPQAWDEKLDAYYRTEFLPRLAPNVEGAPSAEAFEPGSIAGRYLQYHYVAANPKKVGEKRLMDRADDDSHYAAVHGRYNAILRGLVDRFRYYDLFLIDLDTGDIVYTVQKETDFATSLENGPYRESNLARLFKTVREEPDRGSVHFADFKAYRPSYAEPAAFIATPVYDGKKAIGVLALQLPVDEINDVMTGKRGWKQEGLGDTGETYLVGPDSSMRSVSRFLVEDRQGYLEALRARGVPPRRVDQIARIGTSILLQDVDTEGVRSALDGKEGTRIIDDYRGIPVLSSYAPLGVDGLDWIILSEMDLSEANAPVRAFERRVLVSTVLLVFAITLVALYLAHAFVRPIYTLIAGARRVGEGHNDVIVSLKTRDELGELAETFNEMVQGIRQQTEVIEQKNRENEALLLNILPGPVVRRLKGGEERIADNIHQVTVLFASLVGFAALAEARPAEETAAMLNELVDSFDEAADRHGVEKVKTMGEKYMSVCGLSVSRLDHARRAVEFAEEMLGILRQFNQRHGTALGLQIGINSGTVKAGIVGAKKFIYDLWGETVNIASRMHEEAEPNTILVTESVHARLGEAFEVEERNDVALDGTIPARTWAIRSCPSSPKRAESAARAGI